MPEWLRFLKSVPGLYLAIYGLAVILIIVFMPDGIWGFVRGASAAVGARRRSPSGARRCRCVAPAPIPPRRVALEVEGLAKYFGGLKAVDGVDLRRAARRACTR